MNNLNNLVNVKNINGQLLVSSREIATNFEKRHNDVVKAIENLTTENFVVKEMFIESTFEHKGNFYKEYLMNRDGFSLLVMGFTGTRSMDWKLKYIEVFNKMEQQLKNPYFNMSPELKAIFELDKKQQQTDKRVDYLYNNMTIDYEQQEELLNEAKRRAIEILGGYNSNAYKKVSKKVFSAIWRDYKSHFKINSYKNTAIKDFENGLMYLANWKPNYNLSLEISTFTNQIEFAG
ncbi:ORF6C domain-containing protein [Romboutsia sp. 1001216sp1]|uniref:Rha family transcriptional regulator n=1 Tax=unclassified Romboutsia TaxID=2626894 RepID=UPI00189CACB9|nr:MULTISPECIES: Rha family transcriptional regulator [unclassified Romboutsia]MDB8790657.1 ORF6C domain-containing protein [Romboutsia sp. 1001216sp1]MDB8803276.1 ORF6C domain-containing protein [Romboutsia sp. 1001216sp1]MDB8814616.1 ORF6C domain-containing protein [Romboutsia sp. 1001216sp1]